MEHENMSREDLLAEIAHLHKRIATSKEVNQELSSQLQAKDVEVMRLRAELERLQADCIRNNNNHRRTAEQYKSLVAHLPGAVYRCANDANWTMEFISAQIEDLTGYPPSDFIDNEERSYNSVIHPQDVIKVVDAVNEGLKHHKSYIIEYRLCHKDGSIIPVYERGAGVYSDDGDLLYLDGVIFDVIHNHREVEDTD